MQMPHLATPEPLHVTTELVDIGICSLTLLEVWAFQVAPRRALLLLLPLLPLFA